MANERETGSRDRVPGERCPRWHYRPSVNAFEDLAHCGWCDALLIEDPGIVKAPISRRSPQGGRKGDTRGDA